MRAFTLLFSTHTTSKKIGFAMYMNGFSAACHPCKCMTIHRQILQTDTAMIFVGGCWSWWWWIRATSFSLPNGRTGCSGCCFLCIDSRFTGLPGLRSTFIRIHSGGNDSGQRLWATALGNFWATNFFVVDCLIWGGICRVQS